MYLLLLILFFFLGYHDDDDDAMLKAIDARKTMGPGDVLMHDDIALYTRHTHYTLYTESEKESNRKN